MPVSEGGEFKGWPVPDRAAPPPAPPDPPPLPSPPRDAVLVVMAKAPRPGEVKTRLVPPLRPEDAAALHRCCVLDTLEKVSRLDGVDIALAYWPPDAEAEFDKLWSGEGLRFSQAGRDLGERMLTCFRRVFDAGYRCAALHGTDIPLASAGELARGFERLRRDSADLVLGPTDDGGYYFIGARAVHPELFEGGGEGGGGGDSVGCAGGPGDHAETRGGPRPAYGRDRPGPRPRYARRPAGAPRRLRPARFPEGKNVPPSPPGSEDARVSDESPGRNPVGLSGASGPISLS